MSRILQIIYAYDVITYVMIYNLELQNVCARFENV